MACFGTKHLGLERAAQPKMHWTRVPEEGAAIDDKQLRSFCKERVAAYKVPKAFEIVPDLPRNPTGKVLKRMLK